ncbi:YcjX family protein [Escherichia coli]
MLPRQPIISTTVNSRGLHFLAWALCLAGRYGRCDRAAILPWPDVDAWGESKLAQADKHTNAGMLRERFNYYCEKVVKGLYKNLFLRFDRQIVLVDCLQPLNSRPQAFNDMRLALTQLMQSFHYGQRTLFRAFVFAGYR